MNTIFRLLISCICFLLFVGCNKSKSTITAYPVTGTVKLNGKPLEGATVMFANGNRDGFSASGNTDNQGKFRLTTYVSSREGHAGAEAGEYTVLITKPTAAEASQQSMESMKNANDTERQKMMMERWKHAMDNEKAADKPKSEVPDKYGEVKSSPLKATVIAGDNPPFEWDLTD